MWEPELGRISSDRFASRLVDERGLQVTPASFVEHFAAWPKEPYDGVESLVARLREHHHVSCLSNDNPLHWERFGGLLGWFDSAFSSHLLGHAHTSHRVAAPSRCRRNSS